MKLSKREIPVMEPDLSGNEREYLLDAFDSGWISSKGKYVDLFEERFASYHDVEYALAVSNGTVALHLSLVSLGIGHGDEVIVPNLTFASSVNTIIHAGATPVLADVDKDTFNIDPNEIESLITERTKAIMVVHLYGNPCDMEAISFLADKHNLHIIEDSAEGLGSRIDDRLTGTFGNIGTFSFFGNKTITTGEGGAILFRDKKVYEHAKTLRDHGMSPSRRYWHEYIGYNYRLTNLQAAIGYAQMERLEELLERKQKLFNRYRKGLEHEDFVSFQKEEVTHTSSYWLITLIFQNTDMQKLSSFLREKGIDTRPSFYPIHTMPPYKHLTERPFPNSDYISNYGLSLPSFPSLTDEDVEYVVDSILKYYE